MRDNQNRDLTSTKKWQEIEAACHDAGIARMEEALKSAKSAEWVEFEGVTVLRIGNNKFVAVPTTGRKNARKFDIINIETRKFVCQVNKNKVYAWLIRTGATNES